MTWPQLFGLLLFSAHMYGRSQLVATTSYVLASMEEIEFVIEKSKKKKLTVVTYNPTFDFTH